MKEKLYNTLPFIIFIIGIVATFFLWQSAAEIIDTQRNARIKSIERQVCTSIKDRLDTYADAHFAGAGLFLSSNDVTRKDWREFVETINLFNRYPGINGLGYALPVKRKDTIAFLATISKDEMPDFAIKSITNNVSDSEYYVIKLIEPIERNMPAVGVDMGSEANRREAMDESRFTGKTTITRKVILVQDTTQSPGFLMYVPFYKEGNFPVDAEERNRNFIGWIYSPFIAKNLFTGLINGRLAEVKDLIGLQIYDGNKINANNLLYETDNFPKAGTKAEEYTSMQTLRMYNNTWTIVIKPTRQLLSQYSSYQPLMILVGGLIISASLFYIAMLLARTRRQSIKLAEKMTIELRQTNEELRQKNLDLERSNNDLEQFAYVASHDLKEPLRMVSAYTQLLSTRYKNILDEDGKTFLSFAREGAERMASLINDLLSYSRLGRSNIKPSPVDLNMILAEILRNNELQIEETGAQVISGNLPVVMGSGNYFYSLFQNLISNALKFRKDISPVISIQAEKQNNFWLFSVKDNGIGIDPQHLDKIFIIFQRLHTRDKYSGTGIGLAICKKIVEFHGGQIWVESAPGEGTTFFFTIPVMDEESKLIPDQAAE